MKTEVPKLDDVEAELKRLKTERRNITAAIALHGEASPEMVEGLKRRSDRIRTLEAELVAAKRTPELIAEHYKTMEAAARAKLKDLRTTLLRDAAGMREVLTFLFPDGLQFSPRKRQSPS